MPPELTELEATHSHLFPGARLRVTAKGPDGAVIRFTDGSSALARLAGDILSVEAYETGAGTRIPTKVWRVSGDGAEMKVTARL